MDFIAQERDRLLRSTTRVVGIVCALISVIAVLCALAVPAVPLLGALACIAIMVGGLLATGYSASTWWTVLTLAGGLGAVALLLTGVDADVRPVIASAIVPLASGGLSAPLMSQRGKPVGLGLTIAAGAAALVAVVWGSGNPLSGTASAVALGWVLIAVVTVWISRSIPASPGGSPASAPRTEPSGWPARPRRSAARVRGSCTTPCSRP